jgi:hypothetical protein
MFSLSNLVAIRCLTASIFSARASESQSMPAEEGLGLDEQSISLGKNPRKQNQGQASRVTRPVRVTGRRCAFFHQNARACLQWL